MNVTALAVYIAISVVTAAVGMRAQYARKHAKNIAKLIDLQCNGDSGNPAVCCGVSRGRSSSGQDSERTHPCKIECDLQSKRLIEVVPKFETRD